MAYNEERGYVDAPAEKMPAPRLGARLDRIEQDIREITEGMKHLQERLDQVGQVISG